MSKRPFTRSDALRLLVQAAGVFVVFAICNQLGSLFTIEASVSVFYPASAVAVVACMLFGPLAAIPVILATVATPWTQEQALWQLLVSGVINALEGLIPWAVFRYGRDLYRDLRNKRSLFLFLVFGTVVNSAVSAIIGNLVLIQPPQGKLFSARALFIWWVSDFSAVLLIATPVLAFAVPMIERLRGTPRSAPRTMANVFEVTAVIILIGWIASTAIRTRLVDSMEQELIAQQRAFGETSRLVSSAQSALIKGDQASAESLLRTMRRAEVMASASPRLRREFESVLALLRVEPSIQEQQSALLRMRSAFEAESTARWNDFVSRRERIRGVSLLMDLTVLPILLLAAAHLIRSIAQPLSELHRGVEKIAAGTHFDRSSVRSEILEIESLARALDETSSALRLREQQLLMETERAVAASRHKSDFLAKMSHELRTPLNAIVGFSELLLDQGDALSKEKRAAFVKNVWNSGNHLLKLINDLLDLAKLEAGKMRFEFVDVDARQLVISSVAAMTAVAARRHQEIRPQLPTGRLIIRADPMRIEQVLLNLLSNACKFSGEGTRIDVTANADGAHCVIEVRDSGPGIAPEDQQRIFGEFEQVAGTAASEGTGLGLALVRYFVAAHHGEVSLESTPGQGSTFRVKIPLAG